MKGIVDEFRPSNCTACETVTVKDFLSIFTDYHFIVNLGENKSCARLTAEVRMRDTELFAFHTLAKINFDEDDLEFCLLTFTHMLKDVRDKIEN